MKTRKTPGLFLSLAALIVALTLAVTMLGGAVLAEERVVGVPGDISPAVSVSEKNANSVVGVITNQMRWSRQAGESEAMVSQGSGVVIAEGYVLTNYHVIEGGNRYQVALPSGETVAAELVGSDASTDLAVLKVDSSELVPVEIGASSELVVGSTAIAIGNPGGTALANTVTSGIVSALERTSVNGGNTTRQISYIQHDAAINSGNSGGGLFNINGQLVGINTLKYAGSAFSSIKFEGLGFAIPIDTAYPIAMDLIQYGKVQRPQLGVMVATFEGPDQATNDYPPQSVLVSSITAGSPAERAGLKPYDFITEIDGTRVNSLQDLTTQLDQRKVGDTVTLTVVRYANASTLSANATAQQPSYTNPEYGYGDNYGGNYGGNYGDFFNNPFGNYFGYQPGYQTQPTFPSGNFETLKIDVTLEVLD